MFISAKFGDTSNMGISLGDLASVPKITSWSGGITDGKAEIQNTSKYPLIRVAKQMYPIIQMYPDFTTVEFVHRSCDLLCQCYVCSALMWMSRPML